MALAALADSSVKPGAGGPGQDDASGGRGAIPTLGFRGVDSIALGRHGPGASLPLEKASALSRAQAAGSLRWVRNSGGANKGPLHFRVARRAGRTFDVWLGDPCTVVDACPVPSRAEIQCPPLPLQL